MEIRKALVVDDSKLAAMTLGRLLAKKSIEVISAGSGEEAIERLKSDRPDVIFMDFMMPGMDGYQATQMISTNPHTAQIPVVMCTSADTPEDRDKASGSGASGFLTKPVAEDALNVVLEGIRQIAPVMVPEAPLPGVAPLPVGVAEEGIELVESTARAIAEQVAAQVAESAARTTADRVAEETVRRVAQAVTQDIVNSATQRALAEVVAAAREALQRDLAAQTGQMVREEGTKFVHSEEVKQLVSTLVQQQVASVAEPLVKSTATQVAEGVAQRAARLIAEETANKVADQATKRAGRSMKWATTALGVVLVLVVLYLLYDIWVRLLS
jgi:CheY-like chemotaxis protein